MKLKSVILAASMTALSLMASSGCSPKSDLSDPEVAAATALCRRVTGNKSGSFVFRSVASDTDAYTISSESGKIVISGNCANSMAVGLNQYLRRWCNADYGWLVSDKLSLPRTLPLPEEPYSDSAKVSRRFFLNYCTYGYSMPWWQWGDWEHLIDWMALNGVNMALAITGQESIWYQVWTELGLGDEEVRAYFTGPAHLPWHRMQNIDRWGGPLPQSWLDGQLELQKQITARERELGIIPVLPAFSGHVPAELSRIYPDAPINRLSPWSGYPEEYACSFLDPTCELYGEIQKKFVEKETEIYGTDHIYGLDIFNELTPPSWEPEYLGRVSRQIYETLEAADPEAVWLQMGWLFYINNMWTADRVKAYLTSFAPQKQLMLDYFCEREEVWKRTDSFYGVPYIWCYLGNFGGNTELIGDLHLIDSLLENVEKTGGENFNGIGSTLEGIDCNPFVYEYVFEKAWNKAPCSSDQDWVESLAARRNGCASPLAVRAWKTLVDSVYVATSDASMPTYICQRPNIGRARAFYGAPKDSYDNRTLVRVMDDLLASGGSGSAYEFDLVNVERQVLSNYFDALKRSYDAAYEQRDRARMAEVSAEMMELLDDIDELLGTQTYFLMGKWIDDARHWGADPEQKDFLESNSRNLLTTWSDANAQLNDYACRVWNGLTATFYKPRYEIFHAAVEACLDEGASWDDAHYAAYEAEVTSFEKRWWDERMGNFTAVPQGDSRAIAAKLHEKYKDRI